jgi:hypothetical protein
MNRMIRWGIAALFALGALVAVMPDAYAQACFWRYQYVCNWDYCSYMAIWTCG